MTSPSRRILLMRAPVSLEDIYSGLAAVSAEAPPLNLLLLAAIARERGFEPHILDCPAQGIGYEEALLRVRAIAPRVVGFTSMTPHIMQTGKLAALIKKDNPGLPILLGGAHVTCAPLETLRRLPAIDVGFVGEADHTLPEFLDALESGRPASDIPGLVVRENGGPRLTATRAERVDLDALPDYAWDLLPGFPELYKVPLFAAHRYPATPILTSRGCPGKCIYCFSGGHKTMAAYSAERILAMLKFLKERYGMREFMIYDDNFVMFRKNLKRLLELIVSENLDMTWSCNARVDMVDEELLTAMAMAGCWQISFGVETGDEEIMARLEKRITRDKIIKVAQLCRKLGIRTVGYFMIGHFGETRETIRKTEQFALDSGLDDIRMSFFTPLPGTKAHGMAAQFGEFEDEWEKMTLFSPVFVPRGMTKPELIREQKRVLRRFFFRPRVVWSYLKMVRNPVVIAKAAFAFARYALR